MMTKDKITVVNNSNVPINADVTYTAEDVYEDKIEDLEKEKNKYI